MIEPGELTIDDLVKVDQTTETVTARVLGVHKDGVINYEVDYSGVRATDITHADYVSPIGLTEEILVKNGFIFNKGYAVLQVSEDTYLDFYKHEHRLRKVWEGIDEWNNHAKIRDVSFVCQCYYVHEFQHALRLAGVQKEIEL